VGSAFTKVTPTKCSFKAEVFLEGKVACMVKIKIQSDCANSEKADDTSSTAQVRKYAVRFQRRSGCAFVFQDIFDTVSNLLGEHGFHVFKGEANADDETGWFAHRPLKPSRRPSLSLSTIPDVPGDIEHDLAESESPPEMLSF